MELYLHSTHASSPPEVSSSRNSLTPSSARLIIARTFYTVLNDSGTDLRKTQSHVGRQGRSQHELDEAVA